jgi:hypothetical protein
MQFRFLWFRSGTLKTEGRGQDAQICYVKQVRLTKSTMEKMGMNTRQRFCRGFMVRMGQHHVTNACGGGRKRSEQGCSTKLDITSCLTLCSSLKFCPLLGCTCFLWKCSSKERQCPQPSSSDVHQSSQHHNRDCPLPGGSNFGERFGVPSQQQHMDNAELNIMYVAQCRASTQAPSSLVDSLG